MPPDPKRVRLLDATVAIPGDKLPESCEFYAALFGLEASSRPGGSVTLENVSDEQARLIIRGPGRPSAKLDAALRHQRIIPRFAVNDVGQVLEAASRLGFHVWDIDGRKTEPTRFLTVDPNGLIIEVVAASAVGE